MPRIMKKLNNISRSQAVFRNSKLDGVLPPGCHTYVLAICRAPGRTQDELAEDICTSKSTVARRIDWLLDRGYVTREPSKEDKRCLRVYPTDKMLGILPEVRKITQEWNSIITEGISDEDMAVFESVLSRMEAKAKAAIGKDIVGDL
jgi:DNA-binding MarR family transcriptional regulator